MGLNMNCLVFRCRIESESGPRTVTVESVDWLFLLKDGGDIVITWWKSHVRYRLKINSHVCQNIQDLQCRVLSVKLKRTLMHLWMLWKGRMSLQGMTLHKSMDGNPSTGVHAKFSNLHVCKFCLYIFVIGTQIEAINK